MTDIATTKEAIVPFPREVESFTLNDIKALLRDHDRLAAENAELIAALDHYAMPLSTR